MTNADALSGRTLGASAGAHAGSRRRGAAQVRDVELTSDLARVHDGDDRAFSRIYRAVQPGLLRYLSALVGSEADDVASETWAQVCRDLSKFRGDFDDFRAWVATIGRHRALDHHRARTRRPVAALPVEESPGLPTVGSAEGVALEAISTADAVALIASLPQDQAEAVLLRTVLGLDAKSAGRVMGKRAGAVRTAAYRGLQTLAERIDHDPTV